MFCPNCGNANPDHAAFCNACGTPLAASAAPQGAPPAAPPVAQPHQQGPVPGALPPNLPPHYHVSQAPYAGPTETSGKAIGALIFGLLFFIFPSAILAIILGHWSLSDIRKSGGRLTGRGLGTTGMVLGYLGVVMIPFLIIAAIAIPNLLRARIAANESAAVVSLRTMTTALVTYNEGYGAGYPTSLAVLATGDASKEDCNHAGLINPVFATGRKGGYVFYYTPKFPGGADHAPAPAKGAAAKCSAGASGYEITADPITESSTGVRHFFVDESGVIRYSIGDSPANADSTPLE